MKIPKSYDMIGDILIFETKEKISSKEEKEIADYFLKTHNNVKVVAKRSSFHEGEYRLRKIKILAGEKRKETIHKENGVRLKLNVEKCYFSSRTGSERLRLAQETKEGEEVLVMFSGIAPFPIVISKNSKAKKIYGIEINPIAHKYALENLKLNRIENVNLFNGDVKDLLPKISEERKPLIGIKSHWNRKQLEKRISCKPRLVEIHLNNGDLESYKKEIESIINYLKKKKIRVMIHQPNVYKTKIVDPNIKENIKETKECYELLYSLCKKHKLEGFILHPSYWGNDILNEDIFAETFKDMRKKCKGFNKYAFLENVTKKANINALEKLKKLGGFDNVCIDLVHCYIALKNNKKIYDIISKIDADKIYFHIGDSIGKTTQEEHSLEIGKGKLDFNKFKDIIKYGIIEVQSKNELVGKEIINSYHKYMRIIEDVEKFDKIVMPLPKTAKAFLGLASKYIREKGIIYLYMFSGERELNEQEKEVKKLAKNFQIIKTLKVGQYAPGVNKYRVELKKKGL